MTSIFPVQEFASLRHQNNKARLAHRERTLNSLTSAILQQGVGSIHCTYRSSPTALLGKISKSLCPIPDEIENPPQEYKPSPLVNALLDPPYRPRRSSPEDLYVQPYTTIQNRVEAAARFLYPRKLSSHEWLQHEPIEMPPETFSFMRSALQGQLSKDFQPLPQEIQGAFSQAGTLSQGNITYFTKQKLTTLQDPLYPTRCINEWAANLLFMHSPHIAQLKAMTQEMLVIEHLGNTSLDIVLDTLPYETFLSLLQDIIRGLQDLADKELAHNDLKPENIVVYHDENNNLRAKLIDFGFTNHSLVKERGGTPHFLPPEHFKNPYLNQPSKRDVFAVGILIYLYLFQKDPELLLPQCPAVLSSDELAPFILDVRASPLLYQELFFLMSCQINLTTLLTFNKDPQGILRSLIKRCLDPNPDARPPLREILEIPSTPSDNACSLS